MLILIRAILKQSIHNKMVSKFKLECLLLICTYTNAKFIVIMLLINNDTYQRETLSERPIRQPLSVYYERNY